MPFEDDELFDDAPRPALEPPRLDDAFAPPLPLLLLLDDLPLEARPEDLLLDLEAVEREADFDDFEEAFAPVERELEPFDAEALRPVLRDAVPLRADDLLPPLLEALLRVELAARPAFELFEAAALRAGAAFFVVRLDEAALFFAGALRAVDLEDDLLPEDFDDDFAEDLEPEDFDDDLEPEDFEPDDDFVPLPDDDFLDDAALFFDAAMCFSFFKKFAWGVVLF